MGIFQNNLMGAAAAAASAGGGGFYSQQIANSIRADTNNGYLHRTPSSAGNRATWTFSTWIKLAQMGTGTRIIYSAGSSGDQDGYYRLFYNANKLIVSSANANFVTPSDTFRDPSAWAHIVWKQGSNATTLYVNGSQIATASVSGNTAVNNNTLQCIGTSSFGGSPTNSEHLDGYFAETIMIDGTALDADSFGETKNGVWIPKDASGLTFGTNGFHLKYESSSDLGNDSSGNNNDWTAVNLATHDQMLDTPTFNSDSNGGNFITYNPLNKGSYTVLSEGNLKADSNTGADATYPSGTFGVNSGKWYVEHLIVTLNGNFPQTTLVDFGGSSYNTNQGIFYAMRYHPANGCEKNSGDNIADFGTITIVNTGVATFTTGDIVSWYIDMDNKKAWIAKNGTIPNSGDPANGTNPQFSWTENPINSVTVGSVQYQTSDTILNAGQDGTFAGNKTAQGNSDDTGYGNFYYAPPTGFLALCSGNQPVADAVDPAQTDDNYPQKLFTALAYSGNGGGSFTTGFQPDWVWVKARNTSQGHGLWDSTRGVTKVLNSNLTNAEATSSGLTAFNTDGYTMGNFYNQSGNTYASWSWRANGGTTSSNSNGSITSTVQVDPSGCFSIVKYTGQSASRTVGHGLSTAPDFIIVKSIGAARNWAVYYGDTGKALQLNNTNAPDTGSYWNSTAPTSSVFSVADVSETGKSEDYIAYCFADTEGYIKSGLYVGNGSTDNAFVYTGFRPAFVMIKGIAAGAGWNLHDIATSPHNLASTALQANSGNAELSNYNIDILSNGIKIRDSDGDLGTNGNTYVYLAIAKNPFKYATAR
jgi:hypothetical protein